MKTKYVNYWLENRHLVQEEYEKRSPDYHLILDRTIKHIEKMLEQLEANPIVKGRVKSFQAFHRKILIKTQNRRIRDPFKEINDIVGLRIVVPFLEDLHSIEDILKMKLNVTEIEHKSMTLSIKEFGYDSTHFIIQIPQELMHGVEASKEIQVEVQLRTILQDAWAEVEHELVYKSSLDKVETTIRRKLIALNATLSLADTIFQEIRDYQQKRILELQERHNRLIDKVSTVPQKMGEKLRETDRGKAGSSVNVNNEQEEAIPEINSGLNDLFVEALNAHLDNDLERAAELYSQLIEVSPNHYIYNHRGLVYLSLSNYEKAIADFTKAIELEPNDTRVYTNRGLAYRMVKKLDRALEDFNKSENINPLWPDTFYGRSLTYYDLGNLRRALEDCDRAISLKPGFKQAVRFKQFLMNQEME